MSSQLSLERTFNFESRSLYLLLILGQDPARRQCSEVRLFVVAMKYSRNEAGLAGSG